jgi:TetR/AcrR family transcriptional regulator
MSRARSGERRQQILETLARLLQDTPGQPIRTAALAREAGVSEAALYRHFPGKTEMFEELIRFAEDSLFSRIRKISDDSTAVAEKVQAILTLVLGFADHNPGISRVLSGDALVGETEQLRKRVAQLFDRLQTELRQLLRDAGLRGELRDNANDIASVLIRFVDGAIAGFVRSGFRDSPLLGWEQQWALLRSALFA